MQGVLQFEGVLFAFCYGNRRGETFATRKKLWKSSYNAKKSAPYVAPAAGREISLRISQHACCRIPGHNREYAQYFLEEDNGPRLRCPFRSLQTATPEEFPVAHPEEMDA